VSQAREAWEPNVDPHEREVMDPSIGAWRTGHDLPADYMCNVFLFKINIISPV